MSRLTFRKGSRQDLGFLAELIYQTEGKESFPFYGNKKRDILKNLRRLVGEKSHRYSFDSSIVALYEEKKAGMVIGFSYREFRHLVRKSAWIMFFSVRGWKNKVLYFRECMTFSSTKEMSKDEYYITNIAVKPEFQGHGIGKSLMQEMEKKAKNLHLAALSLIVHNQNTKAIDFYKALGYARVERQNFPDYYRMRKNLSP